jgi:uncharacterized protein YjdB
MKIKLLGALAAAILFLLPIAGFAQAPTLGVAANFVLFTTIGPVTNSGIPYLTHLTGNVGTNTGSSTGFGNVDGQMHDGGPTSSSCAADVISLYGQLNMATPTFFPVSPVLGGGVTLVPGIYQYPLLTACSLNLNLILDGQGDPNALFIIKIDGAFSTSANAKVELVNGALACNVFWLVEGMIDMGAGTTMRGTMLAHNDAINMGALDTLEGRALSINGAITTNSIMAYMPLGCGSPFLTGPAAPALVSTASFGVFSSLGPVTSTPVTYVNGDVGSATAGPTGFDPLNVTGTIYGPGAVTAAAAADLLDVYNYLNALPTDIDLLHPDLFGHDLVLTPHTYHMAAAPISLTGSVYLNAQGNPNAVFVINMNGAFITSVLSKIVLINGTQAQNVYWKIDGAVHVYDNSVFNGTIVAAGAIDFNTGDTLRGRAMTINGAVAINGSFVNTTPAPCVASTITGTDTVCVGMTTLLTSSDTGRIWHSSDPMVATVDSVTGLVTGVAAGTSIITLTTGLACENIDTVTVNPSPLPVTSTDSVVCVGSTLTYASLTSGGTWSSSDALIATVGSLSGIITGVASGTANITYTLSSGCSVTKRVTVNPMPSAGAISGTATVCPANTTTLSSTVSGGIWTSVTTATATIGSSSGIVTGVAAGTTTISYTVTNSCGTASATTIVTVSPSANAGTITGTASLCPTDNVTLSNTSTGGTWTSVTPATATIGSTSGIVTGVAPGTTTISYTVTNSCGTAAATKVVTVNATTTVGAITGTATVCPANTTTLSNTTGGGVWTSVTTATATIGSSTGIVTGVAAGTTTISYTVTNSCGTAVATIVATVNPSPNAGTITGTATVCPGNTTTLSNVAGGGVWTSVTTATATVGSSSGVVTGVVTGTSTISYTVTNSCGTVAATIVATVNPMPNAGAISGTATVCPGNTTTLSNTASGGVWSSVTTSTATIGSSTGIVTGVAAGTTTISYTVTNSCGTAVATIVATVNPSPNAGTIIGTATVCPGNTTTLTNVAGGGIWTSVTTATATIGSSSGIVTGIVAGTSIISYTVTNSCGTAAATRIATVNPMPNAGAITGTATVCPGSTTTLSSVAGGGVWTSVSTDTATVGSSTGIVTGVAAGTTTISYAVTNSCGTAVVTTMVTVNPMPDAGVISGASSVCVASVILLSDAAAGGSWTSSNGNATVSTSGVVSGVIAGVSVISYSVSNSCGTAVATKSIVINPLPFAGVITGASGVCVGSMITLTNSATGGVWTSSNSTATVSGGVVLGVNAGLDTIVYSVTNMCGLATAIKIVNVNALPAVPVISIQAPSNVCTGTMYQNFGAATAAATNTVYGWTAVNAIVWAQGTGHNNALINFTTPGTAYVTLNATVVTTGCASQNTVIVNVGTGVSQVDYVSYFHKHFVATPNTEGSYQWGYDDVNTLDSTILTGEINQDYVNASPDFSNKLYWVMTKLGSCMQKTYYRAPLTVQNIGDEVVTVKVFPNPATTYVNVEIGGPVQDAVQIDVYNLLGQKVSTVTAIANKAAIDVANLAAGSYIISCSKDGLKFNSTRFTKN